MENGSVIVDILNVDNDQYSTGQWRCPGVHSDHVETVPGRQFTVQSLWRCDQAGRWVDAELVCSMFSIAAHWIGNATVVTDVCVDRRHLYAPLYIDIKQKTRLSQGSAQRIVYVRRLASDFRSRKGSHFPEWLHSQTRYGDAVTCRPCIERYIKR